MLQMKQLISPTKPKALHFEDENLMLCANSLPQGEGGTLKA